MIRVYQNWDTVTALQMLGSGILGYSIDNPVYNFANPFTLVTGEIEFSAVYVPNDAIISKICPLMSTAGVYTSTGYNGVGLYTINPSTGLLTLVASSTTSATVWTAAPGINSIPLSAAYSAVQGVYYTACLYQRSAEVTAPRVFTIPTSSITPALDLPNSIKLQARLAGQTALPATVLMSAMLTSNNLVFNFLT